MEESLFAELAYSGSLAMSDCAPSPLAGESPPAAVVVSQLAAGRRAAGAHYFEDDLGHVVVSRCSPTVPPVDRKV